MKNEQLIKLAYIHVAISTVIMVSVALLAIAAPFFVASGWSVFVCGVGAIIINLICLGNINDNLRFFEYHRRLKRAKKP